MIPMVCIVGRSNSGKTTLIEQLIIEFKRRGYRIATIKHAGHGFQWDREGKDSWRHRMAGASTVIIVSSTDLGIITDLDKELSPDELKGKYIRDVDIILAEGYKYSNYPKIGIIRLEGDEEFFADQKDSLIALASNRSVDLGVPCLKLEDTGAIADFIEKEILKKN